MIFRYQRFFDASGAKPCKKSMNVEGVYMKRRKFTLCVEEVMQLPSCMIAAFLYVIKTKALSKGGCG